MSSHVVTAIETQRATTANNTLFSGCTDNGAEGGWYGYKCYSGQTIVIVMYEYASPKLSFGYHDKTSWKWYIIV